MSSVKVKSVDVFNLQDDVVYNNPSIILYASSCNFGCINCHSKDTWRNNEEFELTVKDISPIINDIIKTGIEVTIIGEGGDFYFQLEDWLDFVNELKAKYKDKIKIIWFTGAVLTDIIDLNADKRFYAIDVVLAGRPFNIEGNSKNYKFYYNIKENVIKPVLISEDGRIVDYEWEDIFLNKELF